MEENYSKRELDTHFENLDSKMNEMLSKVTYTNNKIATAIKEIELLKQEDIRIGGIVEGLRVRETSASEKASNISKRGWDLIKMAIPFVGFLLIYWLTTQ